jgi:hypothetical protein
LGIFPDYRYVISPYKRLRGWRYGAQIRANFAVKIPTLVLTPGNCSIPHIHKG